MGMTCTVEVNDLRVRARHGVLPEERVLGNDFSLTIKLDYPFQEAFIDDSVASTLNYAEVVEIALGIMSTPSSLLEHVVGRLHRSLLDRWPLISGGYIRLAKLTPPIDACLGDVAVAIRW